ncbi:MAG: hypothetical protein AAGJ96_04375 [Pseudomonadota bacterium]
MDGASHQTDSLSPRPARHGIGRSYLTSVLSGVRQVHDKRAPSAPDWLAAESSRCIGVLREAPAREAAAYFDRLVQRGVSYEYMFETLFPQIAIDMGEMWNCDTVSFADLSICFSSLQIVMHGLRDGYVRLDGVPARGSLIIAGLESEPHLFGPILLSARLERLGYTVLMLGGATPETLAIEAARRSHLCVGLSCGTASARKDLAAALAAIRSASSAPIIVGGSATAPGASFQQHSADVDLWGPSFEEFTAYLETRSANQLQNVN